MLPTKIELSCDLQNLYLRFIHGTLLDDIRLGAEIEHAVVNDRARIIDALVSLPSFGFVTGHEPEPTPSADPDLKDDWIRSARARRAQLEAMSTDDLRIQCREMLQHQEKIDALWVEHRAIDSQNMRSVAFRRFPHATALRAFAADARSRGFSFDRALRDLAEKSFDDDGMSFKSFAVDGMCVHLRQDKETKTEQIVVRRDGKKIASIKTRTFRDMYWPKARR